MQGLGPEGGTTQAQDGLPPPWPGNGTNSGLSVTEGSSASLKEPPLDAISQVLTHRAGSGEAARPGWGASAPVLGS